MSPGEVSEIAKMVGLVVAGVWAAWTFHKLQKIRAAELDNDKKLADTQSALAAIQKSKLEQDEIRTRLLGQQPQLAIHLDAAETASPAKIGKTLLTVTVTLKNEGEQNLIVYFDPDALTIGRMDFAKDSKQTVRRVGEFEPIAFRGDGDTPIQMKQRILRAGQGRQMALAVLPVMEPSVYLIQFRALYCAFPFDGQAPSREKASRSTPSSRHITSQPPSPPMQRRGSTREKSRPPDPRSGGMAGRGEQALRRNE